MPPMASLRLLAVVLLITPLVFGLSCPSKSQSVLELTVDGPAVEYPFDGTQGEIHNFGFTTPASTEGLVYSLALSTSTDVAHCPPFPMIFSASSCPCDDSATCNGMLASAAPAVPSGAYDGPQAIFVSGNDVNQVYPMMPSTDYFIAFWLVSPCSNSTSSSLSLQVSTAPVSVLQEDIVIENVPFLDTGSPLFESLAYLSLDMSLVDVTRVDGVRVTLSPAGDYEDDFLDCVYIADGSLTPDSDTWWSGSTCNPNSERNPFSVVVGLPDSLPAVPATYLDLALGTRQVDSYNVTASVTYKCSNCGVNTFCDERTGECHCLPSYMYDGTQTCSIPIECHGNGTVDCYIQDGSATKTCVDYLWTPCTLVACNDGFTEQNWGQEGNTTVQCVADSVQGPGLLILWITLAIAGFYFLCAVAGALVYFYQRHKRLGSVVKVTDNEAEFGGSY